MRSHFRDETVLRAAGAFGAETILHGERLDAVMRHLLANEVESVLDLGCGSGALLERLLGEPRFRRIVGVDRSLLALHDAEVRLARFGQSRTERLALRHGSLTELDDDLREFDVAVLIETIEHLEPRQLACLERGVFGRLRPAHVVITTPNREYNRLDGLQEAALRHPDHRFEWDRADLERWASGVAARSGYSLTFGGVGPIHAEVGTPTQMALFKRS